MPSAEDPPPPSDVATLVRRAFDRSVAQLERHEPALRTAPGIEDVHRYRVATRRLRSDLRTFRPVLRRRRSDHLRVALGRLGAVVGAVRDADVQLARMTAGLEASGSLNDTHAEALLDLLRSRRAGALAALQHELSTDAHARLWARLGQGAERLIRPDAAEVPVAEVAEPMLRRPLERFLRAAERLGDGPADTELHRVRIEAKRARYAAEATAPVLGAWAHELAGALTEVQDVLGEHQDAVVSMDWLRAVARDHPELGPLCGRLVDLQVEARALARAAWPEVRALVVDRATH